MLIDYDHRHNLNPEQRLATLKNSVQMALNEIYEAIGISESGQVIINRVMPKADILEVTYPVGSVYYTVLKDFNPNSNADWPGTWVLMNAAAEGEAEPEIYQWKRTE